MKIKILKICALTFAVAFGVGIFFTVREITAKHQVVSIHKVINKETGEEVTVFDDPAFDDYLDDAIADLDIDADAMPDDFFTENPEDEEIFIEDDLVLPDSNEELVGAKNPQTGTSVATDDADRNLNISLTNVAYSDFMSTGANTFSELTSDGAVQAGFDSVHWELNKYFYNKMSMSYTRMLFNMDAMITDSYGGVDPVTSEKFPEVTAYKDSIDYQNYITGIYRFDGEQMESVWRMIDAMVESGTGIWLNTGWKTNKRLNSWYGYSTTVPHSAAPYDLKAFVKANIAFLAEIENRYPGAVQWIGFGNEHKNPEDFDNQGDPERYMATLCTLMRAALDYYDNDNPIVMESGKKITLNHLVVSGQEDNRLSEKDDSYLQEMVRLADDSFGAYAGHIYYVKYANKNYTSHGYCTMFDWLCRYRELSDERMYINETYYMAADDYELFKKDWTGYFEATEHKELDFWQETGASFQIMLANTGTKGGNTWSAGPMYWPHLGGLTNVTSKTERLSSMDLYEVKDMLHTGSLYYSVILMQNYIDAYSDVMTVDWEGEDIRLATFKSSDGDYTFLVEANESNLDARTLNFNLDGAIGKDLYRIAYSETTEDLTDTLIPTPDKTFKNVGTSFSDIIDGDYSIYLYTTKKPVKQLSTPNVVTIKAGESVQLSLDYIDCSGDVTWEVVASAPKTGSASTYTQFTAEKGTISSTGLYTASENAKVGDRVVVKVSLNGAGEEEPPVYAVTLITVE